MTSSSQWSLTLLATGRNEEVKTETDTAGQA